MALTNVSNLFYLGTQAIADTMDGTTATDNPSVLLGNYHQPFIVSVTNYDMDHGGSISDDENNPNGDYVNYDTGSGSTSQYVESSMTYSATALLGDGTTLTFEAAVIQMQNGDVFLGDLTGQDPLDGQAVQSITLNSFSSDYGGYATTLNVVGATTVCFATGTMIETPKGPIAIECLAEQDLILTLDHGPQPIKKIFRTTKLNPRAAAPITFAPNSLTWGDNSGPTRHLTLSPNHRICVQTTNISKRTDAWPDQVLIAAKHLRALPNITQALGCVPVSYIHILLHRHEVIIADGAQAETLLMGPQAEVAVGHSAAWHPLNLLPARPILNAKQARNFVHEVKSGLLIMAN
ncbi:Hint domain-containing protein [Pacificibacter maritimus]|uniref:Hint domain-containing protein n=1 Tax=Pacificibacter maritimus TaxID=762213 RepID=A0A3N4US09_9RHOB|nr:Hint domain-containing protein [Pacificibacter maritimus]RPE71465.1 Hint domain-containing protein [Pacificibacter maritimus]